MYLNNQKPKNIQECIKRLKEGKENKISFSKR